MVFGHIFPVQMTCIETFHAGNRETLALAFSQNKKYLATASAFWTIQVFNLITKKHQTQFKRCVSQQCSMAFLSDNDRLVCVCGHTFITIHYVKNRGKVQNINCLDSMLCVSVCWKKKIFATSSACGEISIWNEENLQQIQYLGSEHRRVPRIKFSQNGQFLATCSTENSINIWHLESGNERYYVLDKLYACKSVFFPCNIIDVVFSSDNKTVACTSEQTVYILDNETLDGLQKFDRTHSLFANIEFLYNNTCVLVGPEIYNIKTGLLVEKITPVASKHKKYSAEIITVCKCSETLFASGSYDYATRLWKICDFNLLFKYTTALLSLKITPYIVTDIVNFVLAHESRTSFANEQNYKQFEKLAFLCKSQHFFSTTDFSRKPAVKKSRILERLKQILLLK